MPEKKGSLTPRQYKAILILIDRGIAETSRESRIPERTLHRWMKQSLFASVLQEERAAKYYRDSARLVQLRPAAITILAKILLDPSTPPATKVRAAESVLDQTREAFELQDLESRLTGLERVADEAKGERTR
jgi:hypothetical protein